MVKISSEEERLILRMYAYLNYVVKEIPRDFRQEGYELINRCNRYLDDKDNPNVERGWYYDY